MKILRYRTAGGARMAIAGKPGRVWTHLVWIDSPMRRVKVANGDVTRYGHEVSYALKRAARQMLQAGKRLGITKSARRLLRAASQYSESS